MSMLVTPLEIVSSVTTSLFDFIWRKKPDEIKRQVMYQDYVDGGLRVPNMEVMACLDFEVFINRCAVKEGELESNSLSFF